jgi:lipase maturation factor 1
VGRAPAFVAPYQPRVDFQLWFLFLGHRGGWVETLLDRLLHDPDAVAPLFVDNPFGDAPPVAVRIAGYRYRFTDRRTRDGTGAWWTRELQGYTRSLER